MHADSVSWDGEERCGDEWTVAGIDWDVRGERMGKVDDRVWHSGEVSEMESSAGLLSLDISYHGKATSMFIRSPERYGSGDMRIQTLTYGQAPSTPNPRLLPAARLPPHSPHKPHALQAI